MSACYGLSGLVRPVVLASAGVCLLGAAPLGGGDGDALRMAVSTNSVSVVGVRVRVGQELIRTYRLRNFAEWGLRDVKVVDAQAVGGVARCPRGALAPLGTMVCRAVVRAAAGRHVSRVTATGVPTWEGYRSAYAAAPAGYDARASVLTLERSASQKRLSYRLVYSGPAPLENVRLRDPLLDPAALRCASGGGLPPSLPAGSDLECGAPAPDQPGPHESVARISGTTADKAVSWTGKPLPPLALAAEAVGGYTVPVPSRPSMPPRRARPVRPDGLSGSVGEGMRRLARGVLPRGAQDRPGPSATAVPRREAPLLPPGSAALPPGPVPPGALGFLGVPVPPGVPVTGDVFGAGPFGPTPGRPVPVVPTAAPLPPGAALSGRRGHPPGDPLEEGMDWAFISLMVVAFPALLAAITSVSRRSNPPGERD
ncbi:hypothetical protein BX283_7733 [Streptomyces sp. TLI_146]|nr:hypothetical protein BX283_7733 [Streptomyces sp. TLI_146]